MMSGNKADQTDPESLERERQRIGGVPVSSLSGAGLAHLKSVLSQTLSDLQVRREDAEEAARLERESVKAALGTALPNIQWVGTD